MGWKHGNANETASRSGISYGHKHGKRIIVSKTIASSEMHTQTHCVLPKCEQSEWWPNAFAAYVAARFDDETTSIEIFNSRLGIYQKRKGRKNCEAEVIRPVWANARQPEVVQIESEPCNRKSGRASECETMEAPLTRSPCALFVNIFFLMPYRQRALAHANTSHPTGDPQSNV